MKKAIPALAAAIMIAAMSTSALATEWIDCGDADGEVQLGFLAGGLDFTQYSRVHLRVGDQWWSTDPSVEPGKPLTVAEFFFDWKMLTLAVADENQETILARLHVIVASSEAGDAKGGVIVVPGQGAWPVACDGP